MLVVFGGRGGLRGGLITFTAGGTGKARRFISVDVVVAVLPLALFLMKGCGSDRDQYLLLLILFN